MILKITLSKEDNQTEAFQISNYYSEPNYLEADIDGSGKDDREIVLTEGLYLEQEDNWERIEIMSDQGYPLISFNKE